MDEKIMNLFLEFSKKRRLFSYIMYHTIKLSSSIFFLIYLSGGIYLYGTSVNQLGFYIAVPFICLLTSYSLRFIIKKPRPFIQHRFDLPHDLKHKVSFSMPSNHASSSFVIALSIGFINPVLGVIVIGLAIQTGLSRVFLGLHYLSDVLIGWLLGFGLGWFGFFILPYL